MAGLPELEAKRPSADSARPPADFADVEPWKLPAVFKSTKSQDVRLQIGRARVQALRTEARALKGKDLGPQTREAFVAHLKRSFGNVMRAWKEGLDNDGNGRLSMMEFCSAVRA